LVFIIDVILLNNYQNTHY